jgi:hypothetical protein
MKYASSQQANQRNGKRGPADPRNATGRGRAALQQKVRGMNYEDGANALSPRNGNPLSPKNNPLLDPSQSPTMAPMATAQEKQSESAPERETKASPSAATPTRNQTTTSRSHTPTQLKAKGYVEQAAALSPKNVDGYDTQQAKLRPAEDSLQLKGGAHADKDIHDLAAQGTQGSGGALPHLDAIQASFGSHDVTGVQAHTGSAAQAASKAIGAEAYATGNNIAFGGSPTLHTAAHEAAHVVQQRSGVSLSGGVGQAGDSYEQHADEVADEVVAGGSAEALLDTMAGGGQSADVQRKAVQRKEVDPGAAAKPTPNAIGYFGLNPGAEKEKRALERSGGDSIVLGEVGNYEDQKKFEKMGQTELQKWIDDFVANTLQLTNKSQITHVKSLLLLCDLKLIDELRSLLKTFAGAERGEYVLERLVFSGHHGAGADMWGEEKREGRTVNYGSLYLKKDLGLVVKAFPKAANQVQDVMMAACWSMDKLPVIQSLFPSLKSVWSYDDFSPTVKQGSPRHVRQWERSTRGDRVPTKGPGATAIWVKGREEKKPTTKGASEFQALRTKVDKWEAENFLKYWLGEIEPTPGGPLRAFYADIQKLRHDANFRSLGSGTCKGYDELAEVILNLRMYHEKRDFFVDDEAALIQSVSAQLVKNGSGYTLPNFATITRHKLWSFTHSPNAALTGFEEGNNLVFLATEKLWELA